MGLSGLAVLTSLSSTGKNLYTNEYVAIKLVSPGSSHTAETIPMWGLGQEEGQCYTPGNPPPPRPSRSPSSRGHRSCTWNTASTSSSAPQVPPHRGQRRAGVGTVGACCRPPRHLCMLHPQRVSLRSTTLARAGSTTPWCWSCSGPAWRTYSICVTAHSRSRLCS